MLTRLRDDSRRGCHTYGFYQCDCGIKKVIRDDAVNRGQISCGCQRGVNLKTHGRAHTPEAYMLDRSKSRARKKGFEHTITIDDIVIPDKCPLLGIPLFPGQGGVCPNSPTLDRIDSSKGYIKDNVWVISYKANTIKNNATLSELEAITTNLRSKIEGRL